MSGKYYLSKPNLSTSKKSYQIESNPNIQLQKLSNNRNIFTTTSNGKTEYYHTDNHWENIRRKYGGR